MELHGDHVSGLHLSDRCVDLRTDARTEGLHRLSEELARKIPKRHIDSARGAHEVVRRAIGPGPAQIFLAFAEVGIDSVDLERVLAH